ncbi:MAG: hypothetical protein AAFU64_15860, partial [Bacteroidota bacterium]
QRVISKKIRELDFINFIVYCSSICSWLILLEPVWMNTTYPFRPQRLNLNSFAFVLSDKQAGVKYLIHLETLSKLAPFIKLEAIPKTGYEA